MKISGKKFLSVFIVIAMLCSTFLGDSVYAADTASVTVFDKNGLKADFKVDSQWTGFFNGTITVTNTGTQPVEDWSLTFAFPHEITNIWNAAIIEHQPGVYTVKNAVWNQDIPVGGSINFGFTAAASGEITRPTFFAVNTKTTEVASNLVKVEYVLYSDWGSGYSAALKITNLSATTIEDWTIDFDYARNISNLSCAKILAHNGTHYTLQNDGYTQNLSAGQTIQLGLGGTGGVAADVPANFIVKQIVPAFDLVSDTDGDLVLDWIEICVNGTDPLIPGEVIPSPTPTPTEVTPTPTEPTPTPIEPTPTTVEPSPTPPVDFETDTDGDWITDYYEALLGTDPSLVDTDGDGLSDYEEVIILGYDPLSTDSDADGTSDYDEDVDQDGLTFPQEKQAGTDCYNSDTDTDGLLDGEEINTYGTNPILADGDGDGLMDGDEIDLSLDPANPATHVVPDAEYTQEYSFLADSTTCKVINTEDNPFSISLDVCAAGNVMKNLKVSESEHSVVMQNDAILGIIPEFDYDESYKIDSVTIKAQIKDEYIANPDSAYAAGNPEYEGIKRYNIFRYFDDINMLLPVETQFDLENQTLYAETDVLGTYCIMDMQVWLDSIGILPEDVAVGTSDLDVSSTSTGIDKPEISLLDSKTISGTDIEAYSDEVSTLSLSTSLLSSTSSFTVDTSGKVKVERYNGHRYAVIDKSLSYLDAKAYCEYMAGHLVTITSQTEQDYINSFLLYGSKNMYWLGGEENNGVVNWITGETSTYTNWASGEPNGAGEIYVHMYRNSYMDSVLGSWNDTLNYYDLSPFHSTANSGFLCEWETPVNLIYGSSLKSCNSAVELSNISDQDWDGDGIPNWKEVNTSLNLGYWNVDGTYIPASYANCLALKSSLRGMLNPLGRLNVNPLLISVIPLDSDPESEDSDGDGLLDGSAQYIANKKVVPKDPNPLEANGPIGIWQAQLQQENSGTIPTELGDWYYYDGNGDSLDITTVDFSELDITSSESVYAFLKKYGCTPDLTSLGSQILLFRMDNQNVALHSGTKEQVIDYVIDQVKNASGVSLPKEVLELLPFLEQWQKIFGYNNAIDAIFNYGTNGNMDKLKLKFFDKDLNPFVLWIWRGHYINCGDGAEMGLYDDPDSHWGLIHWECVDFNLPMTLNLYNYKDKNNIDNIFCWAPDSPQWWITGFNPDYMTVNKQDMVLLGSIDCTGCAGMYDSLKEINENNTNYKDFLIFDEDGHTVWVIWWQK